jgi:predicted nucleotidyltransferase
VASLGSAGHGVLVDLIVAHYQADRRVRAVAVFGSVSTGTWHDLSDVDVDLPATAQRPRSADRT